MREYEILDFLKKKLNKISKRDKNRYECTLKKIDEIINSPLLLHYKNLSYDMKDFLRVHIDKSFVLIFRLIGEKIIFCDLEHHNKVYKK
jgi:YafQ family addiction module toxin component